MAATPEERLKSLGLTLPSAPAPLANYVPALIAGDLLFVSGQISRGLDGNVIAGKLGAELTISQGQAAAATCAISIIAQARMMLGDLSRVLQIVRLTGYVASTPDFKDQPQVVNGASDLFVSVFGDLGRHTRAAVGVASLPAGAAVEIDAILKVQV